MFSYQKIFTKNTFKYLFRFLLSGSSICFVGCPSMFSEKDVQNFVESRGHYFFSSDYDACLFLTSNNVLHPNPNKKPKLVLIYKPEKNQKSIACAKKRGLFTIGISKSMTKPSLALDFLIQPASKKNINSFVFFSIILYILYLLDKKTSNL